MSHINNLLKRVMAGVMMKSIMKSAIGMEETVAIQMLAWIIAQIVFAWIQMTMGIQILILDVNMLNTW